MDPLQTATLRVRSGLLTSHIAHVSEVVVPFWSPSSDLIDQYAAEAQLHRGSGWLKQPPNDPREDQFRLRKGCVAAIRKSAGPEWGSESGLGPAGTR